jgi:flagellar biosynthesis GTPase FlhF
VVNSSPSSNAPALGKSAREKQLEDQIRASTDPAKKKSLERELRDERSRRESDNARTESEANQANQLRESNVQQQKLRSGSRFNLRFKDYILPQYLTPEGLQGALAPWVDFGESTAPVAGDGALHKGLLLVEVERILGPAVAAAEKREGSLVVQVRTYHRGEERITAKFVNDVLIEYAISSN